MSRKNHQMVDGRLLQTDKRFSQLKQKQKEKISVWLYQAYSLEYDRIGKAPDGKCQTELLWKVYEKIEEAGIWIQFGEVVQYYNQRKNVYRKRFEKATSCNYSERV